MHASLSDEYQGKDNISLNSLSYLTSYRGLKLASLHRLKEEKPPSLCMTPAGPNGRSLT